MLGVKDKQMELEQNERIATEVGEQRITMERRMNICDIEVDELREAVDKAERQKKISQVIQGEFFQNLSIGGHDSFLYCFFLWLIFIVF